MDAGRTRSEEDYPRTLIELEERFSTEDACRAYLWQLRWPSGFECPRCGTGHAWSTGRAELWECAGCHHQTSVTAGTVFQGTRKPLVLWFRTIWWVTSQKHGASALALQRLLGFGSYQTAWAWLHKLRRAMVRPGRDRLNGLVEVDETYVGGEEAGVHGRQTYKKAIVAIAVEITEPRGFGRIRMRRVPNVAGTTLTRFVCDSVARGAELHTDGWAGYNEVEQLGYQRRITVHSTSDELAHVAMPGVHRVAALLKRWLLGTHQGAVSNRHLDYYLDEFTFRFNRRTSKNRGKLFYRLVQQAVAVEAVPYRTLVGGTDAQAIANGIVGT